MISFNVYQSQDGRNIIHEVDFTIYMDTTHFIKSTVEVKTFRPFINFMDFTEKPFSEAFSSSFKSYIQEYIYIIFLACYSYLLTVDLVNKIKLEKASIIYHDLISFCCHISLAG